MARDDLIMLLLLRLFLATCPRKSLKTQFKA